MMIVWEAGVVGFRGEQPSTKNEPIWRVFVSWGGEVREGDKGRGRGATKHKKHTHLTFFSCPGGGDCRRSALAQFLCWG